MKKIVALLSATLLATGLTALAAAPASAAPDPTYPLTVTSEPQVAAGSNVSVGQEVATKVTVTNSTTAPVTLFQPTGSKTFLTVQVNGTANNVDAVLTEVSSTKFAFETEVMNDEDAVQWNTTDDKTLAAGESVVLNVSYKINGIIDAQKPSNIGLDVCLNNDTGNDCSASLSWPVVPAVVITCPVPTSVVASNVTKNTATVSWTAPTDPDKVVASYNLYNGSDFLGNTKQLSVDFAEIDPATEYKVDVVSVCGDNIESDKASVTFKTLGLEAANTVITGPTSVDPATLKEGIEISFSGYASNEDVAFQFSSLKDGVYVPFGTPDTLNVGPLGAGKVVISVAFENGASVAGTNFRVTGTGQVSNAVANYDFVTTGDAATNPGGNPAEGGVTPVTTNPGTTGGSTTDASGKSFENCSAAAAAGARNILSSDPRYSKKLDRDGDGVACESDASGIPSEPVWETCAAAANAGVYNIKVNEAGYAQKLDGDNDGVGCEKDGEAPTSLASTGVDNGSVPFVVLFGTLAMLLGGGAVAFARQKLV